MLIVLPRWATAPGMQVAEVDITDRVTVHEPPIVNTEPIEVGGTRSGEVGVKAAAEPGGGGSTAPQV